MTCGIYACLDIYLPEEISFLVFVCLLLLTLGLCGGMHTDFCSLIHSLKMQNIKMNKTLLHTQSLYTNDSPVVYMKLSKQNFKPLLLLVINLIVHNYKVGILP